MRMEEAKLYLEHTSVDDFKLKEYQNQNRYQAIQVILQEIERLNKIIEDLKAILKSKGYETYIPILDGGNKE